MQAGRTSGRLSVVYPHMRSSKTITNVSRFHRKTQNYSEILQQGLWDKINRGTGSSNYARHPYILTQCQYDHLFFVLLSIQNTFCQPKIQIQNCFANNILEDMSLSRSQILPLYPSISMNHSTLHFFSE